MSAKKNLTVAALAALLAVPTFGATNASHALHIPSVTAHADSGYYGAVHTNNLIHGITINGRYWPAGTPIYGSHDGSRIGKNGYITGYFGAPGNDGGKNDYIVPKSYVDNASNGSVSTDNGTNHADSSTGRASMNSGTYNSNDNNVSATTGTNNSTQYASKNSLPQTGESNGNTKAMALSAMALGASASFMALSISEKNRREAKLDSVSSEPTVDAGDGKSDGDDIYDAYYHKIMADTFASIREDFKKF